MDLGLLSPHVASHKGGNRIYHRKELFVDFDYPYYSTIKELTKHEEERGLLD